MTAPTVHDILTLIDEIAPPSFAESWDNVGLMIGSPSQPVQAVHLGLDPTLSLLEDTARQNANVLITHHPFIFKPLKSIRTDQPAGRFLQTALSKNISVIGAHTNLDVISRGVSFALAQKIHLTDLSPLLPQRGNDKHPSIGFGQIGRLASAQSGEAYLQTISHALELPVLAVAGPIPKSITKVAVCGGSGSDFAQTAREAGADLFITGEVKHSIARWAEESGFCIVDAGHYATEHCALEIFGSLLREGLQDRSLDIPVTISANERPAFSYYVNHAENLINI